MPRLLALIVCAGVALPGCGEGATKTVTVTSTNGTLLKADPADPNTQFRWARVTCAEFEEGGIVWYEGAAKAFALDPNFTSGLPDVTADELQSELSLALRDACHSAKNSGYAPGNAALWKVAAAHAEAPVSHPETEARRGRAKRLARARAKQVLSFYRDTGGAERWLIRSVRVEDGDVRARTDLFPKPSNRPGYVGTCTAIMGLYPWMRSVHVEGPDGVGHATWFKGDLACETQGLGG